MLTIAILSLAGKFADHFIIFVVAFSSATSNVLLDCCTALDYFIAFYCYYNLSFYLLHSSNSCTVNVCYALCVIRAIPVLSICVTLYTALTLSMSILFPFFLLFLQYKVIYFISCNRRARRSIVCKTEAELVVVNYFDEDKLLSFLSMLFLLFSADLS